MKSSKRYGVALAIAAVFLAGVLLLTGCGGGGGGGSSGGTGTITGRVIENTIFQTPVPNARITVSGSSTFTFTNSLGVFSLSARAGTRTVTATATGFATKSVMTDVTANMTSNVGDMRLDDQPPPPPGP